MSKYLAPSDPSIRLDLVKKVYLPEYLTFRVRHEGPNVVLYINDSPIPMRTVIAHRLGFGLVTLGGKAQTGELVILAVNNREITLPSDRAQQLGGALLRKADFADDFQNEHGMRAIL